MMRNFQPFDIITIKFSDFNVKLADRNDRTELNLVIFKQIACNRNAFRLLEILIAELEVALKIVKSRFA